MFIKKSSYFDQNLAEDFGKRMEAIETLEINKKQAIDEINGLISKIADEKFEGKAYCDKPCCEKMVKVIALLSDACEILKDDDKYKKVCKKIDKAITKLEDVAEKYCEAKTITESEDVEKEVQEEIEKQQEEG